MKKLWIGAIGVLIVAALLMSLNLIVSASDEKQREQEEAAKQTQIEMQLYKEQISKLQEELENVKEEQYANNLVYENKIAELELELTVKNEVKQEELPKSDALYTYTVADGVITITGYSGSDVRLSVPEKIDGVRVVAVGREAFKNSSFREVILPEGINKIDWFAFSDCQNLEKITIPSSVNKIEYGVFDGVKNITVVCKTGSYAHRYAKSYGYATQLD